MPESERHPLAKSFCCPVCGMVSFNPNDVREGYCGNCHDWTGSLQNFLLLKLMPCEECGTQVACTYDPEGTKAPENCTQHQ